MEIHIMYDMMQNLVYNDNSKKSLQHFPNENTKAWNVLKGNFHFKLMS